MCLFKISGLQTHHVFQPLPLSHPHPIQTLTWITILREEADDPNSKILNFFGNVFKREGVMTYGVEEMSVLTCFKSDVELVSHTHSMGDIIYNTYDVINRVCAMT